MAAYIQFTSRLKSTTQDGILAEAQQIAVSPTDNTNLKTYIDNKVSAGVSAAYRPKGSVTFAGLSALTSASVGDVYNVTDSFTLNGKKYAAGSNVACLKAFSAKVTPDETYWDVLGGFIDLSPYALASDLTKAKTDLEGSISNTNANLARLASSLDERVPNEIRLLDGGDYYQISGQDEAHPAKIGKDSEIGDKISVISNSNGVLQLTHDSRNIVSFDGEKSVTIGGTGNNAGRIVLFGTILTGGNIGITGTFKATGSNSLNGATAYQCYIGTDSRLGDRASVDGDTHIYNIHGKESNLGLDGDFTFNDSFGVTESITIGTTAPRFKNNDGEDCYAYNTLSFGTNSEYFGIAVNFGTESDFHNFISIGPSEGINVFRFNKGGTGSSVSIASDVHISANVSIDSDLRLSRNGLNFGTRVEGIYIGHKARLGDDASIGDGVIVGELSNIGKLGGKDAVIEMGSDIITSRNAAIIGKSTALTNDGVALWFGTDPTTAEGRKKLAFADDVASAKSDVTELAKRVAALEALMTVAS